MIKARGHEIRMKETGCSVYKKKEAEFCLKQSCFIFWYKTRFRVISLYECDYLVLHCVYKESNKIHGNCC